MTPEHKAELAALENIRDEYIDLSDIPEITHEEFKKFNRLRDKKDLWKPIKVRLVEEEKKSPDEKSGHFFYCLAAFFSSRRRFLFLAAIFLSLAMSQRRFHSAIRSSRVELFITK